MDAVNLLSADKSIFTAESPMLSKPQADLKPNTEAFENAPLVKPTGFREYDARWWFGHPQSEKEPELNLMGIQALGMGCRAKVRER